MPGITRRSTVCLWLLVARRGGILRLPMARMGLSRHSATPELWDLTMSSVTDHIGDLAVTLIQDTPSLLSLEAEWKELFASSPSAAPPLRFEWVREWWRIFGTIYGDAGRGLRILTVSRGSRLIGVLPLYEGVVGPALLGMRRLQFISTGMEEFEETCTDYLGVLCAPGEDLACVEAIAASLKQSKHLRWDQ